MNFETVDAAFEHIIMEWATEHPVGVAATNKPQPRPVAKGGKAKAKA